MVERALAPDLDAAADLISRHVVLINGVLADSPRRLVAPDENLALLPPPARFASRGGEKLDGALEGFAIDCANRWVLDVGASTGGFTDCCLQRGAAGVVAVDVGRSQLRDSLRADPRVIALDQTNIRSLTRAALAQVVPSSGELTLVVVDVSFTSVATMAGVLNDFLGPDGDLVILVKPQFEAEAKEVSAGKGVVRDSAVWSRSVNGVISAFAALGTGIMGVMRSPITGASGNVEFFTHFQRGRGRADTADLVTRAIEGS